MVKKLKKPRVKTTKKVKAKMVKQPHLNPAMDNYASLLSNPCRGPLVHAPGSHEGGQISRFETDQIIGNGATDTCGAILWSPGAINATTNSGLLDFVTTGDSVSLTMGSRTYAPGYTFLQTNASSYRCLAACLQIYWPGTELNRAGIVSGAQANYGFIDPLGPSTTVANLRGVSPVVERMPTDYFEIKWAPNAADNLFRTPGGSAANRPEDGHASLLVMWAGLPVATGVRVRMVVVVEWRPKLIGQVLGGNLADYTEGNTFQVRRALDKIDPDWWHKAGQAAAKFLSGATVAYQSWRGPSRPNYRLEL